jgi:hypothetical protein
MKKTCLLGALCMLVLSVSANAAIVTYTDETSFLTALSGPTSTLDFDSTAADTLIPSGNSLGGITFTYNIGPPPTDMKVVNDFETTSPNNYLGMDDAGNLDLFIAGDEFSMSFASPVNAVGLYIVSGDPLFASDVSLNTTAGSALNSDVVDVALEDGGLAYYIGLISDTAFSSADLTFDAAAVGAFLYSVDDITTSAVPLPGAIWLFGSGLVGLISLSRRRKQ